jgi:site-specific DNA-adenine methylase
MMRFNKKGEFNQTFGKRTFNSSTEKKLNDYMDRIKEFQNKNIPITHSNLNYKELNTWFEDSNGMVYLDPPYFNTEAGYNVFWSKDDEKHLLEKCVSSRASVAVSGVLFDLKENSPLLLGLIEADWNKHELDMSYGKIRKDTNNNYQEILLTNY